MNAVLFVSNVNFWNYMYIHCCFNEVLLFYSQYSFLSYLHFLYRCVFIKCLCIDVFLFHVQWCSYSPLPVFYFFLFLLCFLLVLAFYRFTHLFSPFLFYAFLFLPLINWCVITVWFWSRTGWRVSIWGAAVRMSLRLLSFLFSFFLCSWKLTNNSKTSPKS